jgi:hypothetical protein
MGSNKLKTLLQEFFGCGLIEETTVFVGFLEQLSSLLGYI